LNSLKSKNPEDVQYSALIFSEIIKLFAGNIGVKIENILEHLKPKNGEVSAEELRKELIDLA
jgi:hypothetical protein